MAPKEPKKEIPGPESVLCDLSPTLLEEIKEYYHISPEFSPSLPSGKNTILTPPSGFQGIYLQHLKAGMRLPVNSFIATVASHYKVHYLQIAPNAMRKIVCFILISRHLHLEPSIRLFRYFFLAAPQAGWLSFSKRPRVPELCHGLSDSLKKWKPEFFYVKNAAFPTTVPLAVLADLPKEPAEPLTEDEMVQAAQMASNALWWFDPDETLLGLAGLSPWWSALEEKPSLMVEGKVHGLSERLTFYKDVVEVSPPSVTPLQVAQGEIPSESATSLNSSSQLVSEKVLALPPSRRTTRGMTQSSRVIPRKRKAVLSLSAVSCKSSESLTQVANPSQKRSCPSEAGEESGDHASSGDPLSGPADDSTLMDCTVTVDEALVQAACDLGPSGSETPSPLRRNPGLRRTVDLPFPSTDALEKSALETGDDEGVDTSHVAADVSFDGDNVVEEDRIVGTDDVNEVVIVEKTGDMSIGQTGDDVIKEGCGSINEESALVVGSPPVENAVGTIATESGKKIVTVADAVDNVSAKDVAEGNNTAKGSEVLVDTPDQVFFHSFFNAVKGASSSGPSNESGLVVMPVSNAPSVPELPPPLAPTSSEPAVASSPGVAGMHFLLPRLFNEGVPSSFTPLFFFFFLFDDIVLKLFCK